MIYRSDNILNKDGVRIIILDSFEMILFNSFRQQFPNDFGFSTTRFLALQTNNFSLFSDNYIAEGVSLSCVSVYMIKSKISLVLPHRKAHYIALFFKGIVKKDYSCVSYFTCLKQTLIIQNRIIRKETSVFLRIIYVNKSYTRFLISNFIFHLYFLDKGLSYRVGL